MTEKTLEYAQRLGSMHVSQETVRQMRDIIESVPEIFTQLADPTVEIERKHIIIERIFPTEVRDFLKLLCDDGDEKNLPDIIEEYLKRGKKKETQKLYAVLSYVTKPSDRQLEGIKSFLKRDSGDDDIEIELKHDPALISGFKLQAGNNVYDWSAKGRLEQFEDKVNSTVKLASTREIISILKTGIDDFKLQANHQEVGTVISVGDGIAAIDGVDHAEYGEIILFDSGVKGMVQDVRRDSIGCILFGDDSEVSEGSIATRTGKSAGIPVGENFLGRVIDPLGAAIDGMGDIKSADYNPLEMPAPGIVDRQPVSQPMETGILTIDSMFPIGRGQRELIIGDRQTGKTAIAVDTILNQKGKNVVCIYVAVGQKASSVARVVGTLKKYGAMDYSIVVCATASDPAPIQYIAPYSGCSMAEYFMNKGRDVLIIYDDLSKHAVAYRALSLLLGRSPGREAYPGDVFYLHSRLLERAAKLSDEKGGGSITALPIIETQAGDVSAYIPTNVISITDGQIFLESDLFFSGQRPAVNVGLSVSRVGGAAQVKAMKKATGSIRLDLAQYREMEVFTQFSSDLDESTKEQLKYGSGLMQLLRQPQYHALPMHEQVITLIAAQERVMLKIPTEKIKKFQDDMLAYFESDQSAVCNELEKTGELTPELRDEIVTAAKEFLKTHAEQYA